MADSDVDDFDFDEDGIYRERGVETDQGFLDEDGIWREDTDLSHYTLRTDSGFGTGERRPSNSTYSKVNPSRLGRNYGHQLHIQDDEDEFGEDGVYRSGSYPAGEKSLNISDLEASASVAGGYSFDQASLGSNLEVDLPELDDTLLTSSDDQSKTDADVGDLNDFSDFEGNDTRDSNGLFMNDGRGDGPGLSRRSSQFSYTRGSDIYSQPREYPYRHSGSYSNGYSQRSVSQRYSQEGARDRSSQSMAAYLLSGGAQRHRVEYTSSDHSNEMRDEVGRLYRRPRIVGDSLFTQEDQELSYHNRHSLLEFEQLEAAVHGGGVETRSNHSGENMDLIGAYLQGLQDQEDQEDQEGRGYSPGVRHQDHTGSKRLGVRQEYGEGDDAGDDDEDRHQHSPPSRFTDNYMTFPQDYDRRASDRYSLDEESEEPLDNSLEEEYARRKETIAQIDALDHADTEGSQRLSYLGQSEIVAERSQGQRSNYDDQASYSIDRQSSLNGSVDLNNTIPFEESNSLIENQQPPFESLTFTSLDMTAGTNQVSSRQATGSDGSRNTRIPVLRSGSPSMMRPGSITPTRSHPVTPEKVRSSRRLSGSDGGRSLPPTPQRRGPHGTSNGNSPNRGIPSYSPSHDGSFRREDSEEREDQSNLTCGEETELDKATSLLLGDTDTGHALDSSAKTKHDDKSVKSAKTKTNSLKTDDHLWPSSADRRRSVNQRQSGAGRLQPVKATSSLGPHSDRQESTGHHTEEAQERQLNEETLQQLQHDYNSLLQKYARAENTIDSLRIGATIPIHVELTTTEGAANGGPPTGAKPEKAPPGGGSLNNSMTTGQPQAPVSRPSSARGQRSARGQQTDQGHLGEGQLSERPGGDLMASMKGESSKLSLLAKAKAVDEKTQALMMLISESCLSTDDQVQALQNIKDSYENLQQEYRDTKSEHALQVRRGELPQHTPGFDSDKIIEGEVYKLSMKMDNIEHQVEESVKAKSSTRVPFKADHTINVAAMGAKKDSGSAPMDLAPNRPPSVGSFAGGPDDMDVQIHQLNKDYDRLMDRYRRLKQLKKTPQRDREVDGLLKKLRRVYEQTPDHRKPALPPELEKHYNAVNDNFMSSASEAPGRPSSLDLYRSRSKGQESDSLPGLNESDLSIGRHSRGKRDDPKVSSDYNSTATDSTTRQRRQSKRLPNKMPQSGRKYDSYGSVTPSPSRKSDKSIRQDRLAGFPRGREREDKDSGYVGSEAGRKAANQGTDKDRLRQGVTSSGRPGNRLPAKVHTDSGQAVGMDSDISDSMSDLSTVERVRPYRPGGKTTRGVTAGRKGQPAAGGLSTSVPGKGNSQLKMGGASSDPTLNRRGGAPRSSRSRRDTLTDSDSDSQVSSITTRSRPSVKSEQIQTLADEITKLKKEMRHRDHRPPAPAAVAAAARGQQQAADATPSQVPAAQPGTQYALVYGYPGNQQPMTYGAHHVTEPHHMVPPPPPPPPPQGTNNPQHTVYTDPASVAPHGNHGNPYQDRYGIQDSFGRSQERPHPGEWEPSRRTARDRFRDFDDLDGRSGYYSDRGDRWDRDRDRDRNQEKDRERKRRLKDYYIPSRSRPDRHGHQSFHHYGDTQSPNMNGYDRTDGHASVPRFEGYITGGVRTAVQPATVSGVPPPPNYHQLQTAPCTMCGGSGYHTHGEYSHPPQGGAVVSHPAVQTQPQTAPSYVIVPTNVTQAVPNSGQTFAAVTPTATVTPTTTVPSATTYVPVQLVAQTPTASKVRYYVEEYDPEAETVRPLRRSYSLGNLAHVSRRLKHVYLEEARSDSENDDLNSSLTSALKTASYLKKMSRRMKKNLRSELNLQVGAC